MQEYRNARVQIKIMPVLFCCTIKFVQIFPFYGRGVRADMPAPQGAMLCKGCIAKRAALEQSERCAGDCVTSGHF